MAFVGVGAKETKTDWPNVEGMTILTTKIIGREVILQPTQTVLDLNSEQRAL